MRHRRDRQNIRLLALLSIDNVLTRSICLVIFDCQYTASCCCVSDDTGQLVHFLLPFLPNHFLELFFV